MKDIFMFCDSPECPCEDVCCQECEKRSECEKRCENIRYKERIYSDPGCLANALDESNEERGDWLIAVAAEYIRQAVALQARLAKLEAVAQAAKDVISAVELVPGYVVPKISMQRLQQALTALEEE